MLNFLKIKYLGFALVILSFIYVLPFKVFAEENLTDNPSLPYNIYYSEHTPLQDQVVFLTDFGAVVIVLDTQNAPGSTKLFVQLIRNNYYKHTSFYRMYNNYFIQGGDPSESGIGNAGIPFPIENFSNIPFQEGTIALSNKDLQPKTTGSQFFITFLRTPWLDNKYTVIGKVFSGLDILRSFFGKYDTNYRGILINTIPMQVYVLEDYIKLHPQYKNNFKPTSYHKKSSILDILSNELNEEEKSAESTNKNNIEILLNNIPLDLIPLDNLL